MSDPGRQGSRRITWEDEYGQPAQQEQYGRSQAQDDMGGHPFHSVNGGRLWAGGVATAIVAGLAVAAGVYIARDILSIPVLAPRAAGSLGNSVTAIYALLAVAAALAATALLHVLLLGAPRPLVFFGWIGALATLIAVAAPFSEMASLQSKLVTALINLVVGVAVISLLTGVGRSALRRPQGP